MAGSAEDRRRLNACTSSPLVCVSTATTLTRRSSVQCAHRKRRLFLSRVPVSLGRASSVALDAPDASFRDWSQMNIAFPRTRPALIQELTWRPRYGARRAAAPDTESTKRPFGPDAE